MTDTGDRFRVVLRGYDPAQVDRRVYELTETAQQAQQHLTQLSARVRELEEERDRSQEAGEAPSTAVSFAHLGERIGQILALAEDEAEEIRGRGRRELDAERESFVETVARVRGEADRYASDRRSDADTEAARILEDARRTADERIDAADRDAAARLQEAEAVYEEQRARAAKAAADFETTLSTRRKTAEHEFTQQMGDTQRRLEEAEQYAEKSRAEAEATTADAQRETRRLLEEATQQAGQIVNDARSVAARVRAESERELAAATQRRDSINAQLSNVRQMLATLTGTTPVTLLDETFAEPGVAEEQANTDGGPADVETSGETPDAEHPERSDNH